MFNDIKITMINYFAVFKINKYLFLLMKFTSA